MNFNSINDNNTKHVYSKSFAFEKKYLNRAAMYYLTLTSPWKGGQHIHVQDIISTFINVELKMTNELKHFWQTKKHYVQIDSSFLLGLNRMYNITIIEINERP